MDHAAVARAWIAFDHLTPASRRQLEPLGQIVAYPTGSQVFHEGHETPFLGSLESGRVALRLRVPELGDRVTIVTIEPGELLGWSAVVAPFRATVDAIATEPVRILAFDAAGLRARLAGDDRLAAELMPLLLESVARRLTTSWNQLLDLFANRSPVPW